MEVVNKGAAAGCAVLQGLELMDSTHLYAMGSLRLLL
jgi:hypothetical protein